ncbi:MAG: alpha/beta hydrolase [Actinomycetota bacterium]|nr:alpha/beta hydrolase [Actinomycetota bacterium]
MGPQQARVIEVDGAQARLIDAGEGEPVVVLHGWGGRIESMAPVLDCLSPAFRTIALDLPGFGDSAAPPEVWGTPDYARFVRRVLDALNVERAHFIGHSYGGKTSLYLAATDPGAVGKLVVVDPTGLRTPPSFKARAKRAVSRAGRAAGALGPPGRALKEAIYKRVASSDYRDAGAMRPILVRVVNEDLAELLPDIAAPTLIVWGSHDDAVPLTHAYAMEKTIPDAGLVVFEGAGHFPYLEQPDRFCRIVRHFLGEPVT